MAKILLDKEPNLTRQIHVLLKIKDVETALSKAVASQQPNLCLLIFKFILFFNYSKK